MSRKSDYDSSELNSDRMDHQPGDDVVKDSNQDGEAPLGQKKQKMSAHPIAGNKNVIVLSRYVLLTGLIMIVFTPLITFLLLIFSGCLPCNPSSHVDPLSSPIIIRYVGDDSLDMPTIKVKRGQSVFFINNTDTIIDLNDIDNCFGLQGQEIKLYPGSQVFRVQPSEKTPNHCYKVILDTVPSNKMTVTLTVGGPAGNTEPCS